MRTKIIILIGLVVVGGLMVLNYRKTGVLVSSEPVKEQAQILQPGSLQLLITHGGRVSWYKGSAQTHELIAFDAQVNPGSSSDYTEVYTINPDGTGNQCVTCANTSIRKGYVGQPDWYSDGDYMVIQVENNNSVHSEFNHLGWGEDNDLWVVKKNGTGAEKIWSTPSGNAALHPHFSKDGAKIMFAERVKTQTPLQNHWKNWRIVIADFNISASGTSKLSNKRNLTPHADNFYETHEFVNNAFGVPTHMIYSYSSGTYVDDGLKADIWGTNPVNLTNLTSSWDEHSHLSPTNQDKLAFMSSRFFSWNGNNLSLKTELYTKVLSTGVVQRLTFFNTIGQQILVSDLDWNRAGNRIVFQKADFNANLLDPQIWIYSF